MSDSAYFNRNVVEKKDLSAILEKEDVTVVGINHVEREFGASVIAKVLFYFNANQSELSVRSINGDTVTVIADTVIIRAMCTDKINKKFFFSVDTGTLSGLFTAGGIYTFDYNEDTGLPTTSAPFTLIYTAADDVNALFANPSQQKVYFNGDISDTSISRMDYDGTNEERVSDSFGNPYDIWMDEGGTDVYVADGGIGRIIKIDISGGVPGVAALWFSEESSSFGTATHDFKQLCIDPRVGLAFMAVKLNHQSVVERIHTVSFPTPPTTVGLNPPEWSTIIYDSDGSLGEAFDIDPYYGYLFIHNNESEITYRYDYNNGLMQNEALSSNLSASAINASSINRLKCG